jgi:ribonucleoside-diphosphate reductase alpha chain
MIAKQQIPHSGLLPTPPLPKNLPAVNLTENARQVLLRRYVRRGDNGERIESVEEMFWRVAYHIAKVEELWGGKVNEQARQFYALLTSKNFFPNSPTFTGAGTLLGQLAACFVLPITDDMGRKSTGIFQTLRDAALIQQTGGGNGFSFSRLRPKGCIVKSSAGQATGPVGFLRVYDHAFGEVAQGGTRRGANMAVLRVDHPDIEEFITCKTDENAITNFNISVGITDGFMYAVEADAEWDLVFPDVLDPVYRGFEGTLEQAKALGIPLRIYKTVRARELFEKIVRQAHHNGEPGVLFLDTANRSNPVPHLYQLESTNPCVTGETLIYTAGGLQTAADLACSAQALRVVTDGRFESDGLLPASPVFPTGVKDIFRLVTREGYEVRLTANHRVMTSRGWVAAADLQPGEKLHILNRPGGFGSSGTLEEGRILGWLVGDGTINVVRAVLSFFGAEKQELAGLFAQSVTQVVEQPNQRRSYPVGVIEINERDESRVASDRLRAWAAGHGLNESHKHLVPPTVFSGSQEMQRGFLQALFTADGQVNDGGVKGCSARLSSSHLGLLKEVQRLLLNFGIASHIYENRRTAGYRHMPDGKDGQKEYYHQPQHDLAISKTNLILFANQIGFLTKAKQTRLNGYLSRMARGPYRESFLATFAALEPDGREMVYDLQQPDTHSFIANGLVVHNCGEQWLGPYESCCLGSINLAEHGLPGGAVDWEKLRANVELATRFLDNVIDANSYVPSVPALKQAAHTARRIGLGIMGLADLMYHAGIRYGSPEGQEFSSQVMEFVRYHAMRTSVQLARERGAFPAIADSLYDPKNMRWQPPAPIVPHRQDWHRPAIDWPALRSQIEQYGIRNAAQTTIAPTGTIATVAGCEGYGCEPVFALAYIRHVNDNGRDLQLTYTSPQFEDALNQAGVEGAARQAILDEVIKSGSCQNAPDLPHNLREIFVVSSDISAEEHVRMQAALQAFVDNSLSKTVNFSAGATETDVATAYRLAWELQCKGITVYVTGSRDKVVLEILSTAEMKQPKEGETVPQMQLWRSSKKPRPRALPGYTFSIDTPLGKAFITINENGGSQPFEVFINTSKAGSDTAAVSEAIGRLISYILRLASPIAPVERLDEIQRQLGGIGGGRPLGFGPNRVRSLPDGVAQVLEQYLSGWKERINQAADHNAAEEPYQPTLLGNNGHNPVEEIGEPLGLFPVEVTPAPAPVRQPTLKIGDLCPECGQAAVVNEEGCRKCYACGHSEC